MTKIAFTGGGTVGHVSVNLLFVSLLNSPVTSSLFACWKALT